MSAYRPRRMKLCPAWLVLVALIMPSCTRVEIEDHSLQFNQAAGSLGNRVMLLNIVRAAKGYPLQFSKLTGYTGQSRLDGGINLNLPFIANVVGNKPSSQILQGTVTPSATFKTGVQNLQLADLNTAEIQQKLRQQVKARDFAYFRSQGWQKALVNTILIEELYIEPRLVKALREAADATCGPNGSARNSSGERAMICSWRSQAISRCGDDVKQPRRRASPDGDLIAVYENDPRKYCRYAAFQWFFASIRVLEGVSLDVDPKVDTDECKTTWVDPRDEKGGKDKSKEGKGSGDATKGLAESVKDGKVSVDVNVKLEKADKEDDDKAKEGGSIALNIPRGLGLFLRVDEFHYFDSLRNEHLCLLKEGKTPIRIGWRSPERMVRYLGDVLAVQTLGQGDGKGTIQILDEDGHLVDLLVVHKGRDLLGSTAVTVDGPEQEIFSIPVSTHGPNTHLSLQSLALVMESFNQAVSGKNLPQPATIFLSGG
jgi:hypothetical protein